MRARRGLLLVAFGLACGGGSAEEAPPPTPTRAESASGVVAVPAAAGSQGTDSLMVRVDRARIQGRDDAKVWLVEISDFQCPFCKRWHDETYPAVRREYVETGKIRLAYLNFPLPSHRHAWPAAESAMCAGAQGKFWEMHDAIFDSQERWAAMGDAQPHFESLASALRLDLAAWRRCLTTDAVMPLVQNDFDRAVASGTNSTPTFFIGSRRLSGAFPIDSFRVVLDAALREVGR